MPKKLVILYHPKKDDLGEVNSPPYALLSIASLTEDLVDIEALEELRDDGKKQAD